MSGIFKDVCNLNPRIVLKLAWRGQYVCHCHDDWGDAGSHVCRAPRVRRQDSGCGFFPTCQVRVARFLKRNPQLLRFLLASQQQRPDRSGHCRTSKARSASARSQWALPDLNSKRQIAVGTPGPQQQAPDRSGHSWTTTARENRMGTPGPQQHAPGWSGPSTIPQKQSPDHSGHARTSTASAHTTHKHNHRCTHRHNHSHKHNTIFTGVWHFAWQVVTGSRFWVPTVDPGNTPTLKQQPQA